MQDTLIKVAATLGILAVIVVIVGFAMMPKDAPSLRMVRGIAVALVVLAILCGGGVGLMEIWK